MKPGVDNTGLQVYWLLWGCIYPTLLFGFGDNHSYCGCGGWHTNTSYSSDIAAIKNDVVIVREDYKTGTYKVEKPEVVTGTLNKYANGKLYMGGNVYTLNNGGDLPYVISKPVTQWETDTQKTYWEGKVMSQITIYVDSLGNVIAHF